MKIVDIVKMLINKTSRQKKLKAPDDPEYYKRVEDKKRNIENEKQELKELQEQLQRMIEKGISKDSEEYEEIYQNIEIQKYLIHYHEVEYKFIRPNNQEDIKYRNKEVSKYIQEIKSMQGLKEKLNLRFHGTQIYFAEEIIKSGGISSIPDRTGVKEYPHSKKGMIWAANLDSLNWVINSFINLDNYERYLPCGCVFALRPKDDNDEKIAKGTLFDEDILPSVDFHKNPEQLYGIFTTPENIERVKYWMENAGLNPNIVYTFEGFAKAVKKDLKTSFVSKVDVPNNHKGYYNQERDNLKNNENLKKPKSKNNEERID